MAPLPIKAVSPEEASALLAEGYVYVDVRSEPEYEAGHVPGALNVPLLHQGPGGMTPNPEFLSVMQSAFGSGEKMIVGCKAGGRSKKAVDQLAQAGFTELVDMSAGWDGSRDAFGRPVEGWSKKGLPVEPGKPPGQAYADVKARTPKSG
jgi:rhodanese-related sulfurtransferase